MSLYAQRIKYSQSVLKSVSPPIFSPGTLGDYAWLRLAQLTKQIFEKNKQKWQSWIQAHENQIFPDPNIPQQSEVIINTGF